MSQRLLVDLATNKNLEDLIEAKPPVPLSAGTPLPVDAVPVRRGPADGCGSAGGTTGGASRIRAA
jgi:hypothetical protein